MGDPRGAEAGNMPLEGTAAAAIAPINPVTAALRETGGEASSSDRLRIAAPGRRRRQQREPIRLYEARGVSSAGRLHGPTGGGVFPDAVVDRWTSSSEDEEAYTWTSRRQFANVCKLRRLSWRRPLRFDLDQSDVGSPRKHGQRTQRASKRYRLSPDGSAGQERTTSLTA